KISAPRDFSPLSRVHLMKALSANPRPQGGEAVMTEEEFVQAVERYGDTIYRVAYSCLKNRADAEDVMQDTLLKLYRERRSFESEEHRRRWLIRVAVNQAKSLLRSSWFRRTIPLDEQLDQPVFDRPEESELFEQVMALPKNYRLALYLYYYEG